MEQTLKSNPSEIQGGGVIAGKGIEVDAGVLMPSRLNLPAWKTASIKDRMEAVIVHEYTESMFKGHPQAHKLAIEFGPEQARKMGASNNAIKILEEMKAAQQAASGK